VSRDDFCAKLVTDRIGGDEVVASFETLNETVACIQQSLRDRDSEVLDNEKVQVDLSRYGRPIYHTRLRTQNAYYQVKFQRQEHMPLANNQVRTALAENERLKYAIGSFGGDNPTDIGVNQNVLFELMELEERSGLQTYLLNAVGDSRVHGHSIIYWSRVLDFYEFAMRWSTVIYDSTAYGGTVFLVPTGWMKIWEEPLRAFPSLCKDGAI